MALLNCCVYDGHNEYLKERATLCIKWVMEGCMEAQDFVRELSPLKNQKQDVEMVRSKGVDQVGPVGGEDVVAQPAPQQSRESEKFEMERLSRMADAVEKMRIANVAAAKKE